MTDLGIIVHASDLVHHDGTNHSMDLTVAPAVQFQSVMQAMRMHAHCADSTVCTTYDLM